MTKKELIEKLKLLNLNDPEQEKGIICQLIGHSNIVSTCFGYVHCGRCDDQLGDTLGGVYPLGNKVIIGHDCDVCRSNYKKMGWEDKFRVLNPFSKDKK